MTLMQLGSVPAPRRDWRQRLLGGYFQKWVVLGLLIGVVAGLGAILFFESIDLATRLLLGGIADYRPPVPAGEGTSAVSDPGRLWLIPIVTTLGGLIAGLIVFTLAPEAEGHGTDAAIDAFHHKGGKIRSRIPPIKLVASAITIGSGGSAGREGPTAQIAAGFGSWLGDVFHLSPQDRRIAVAVGMGAGIGAIFKAPLGGAILAAEILYIRDFELDAIVPGFIASVVGYSIFATWSGWTPVFGEAAGLRFTQPESLVWYAVLGLAAGGAGILYARLFYGTRDLFHRIPIPPHFKPAIGGLALGLVALRYPQVLAMGYGWLQLAIAGDTGRLAVGTMVALVFLKILGTSLTIGSGGSGGVFAPGLFIGGMLGGAMWGGLHGHVGWLPSTPAPFVIVGMMALFGGIAKAPIAVMLMVAEMTGEFSMIVPAMIAVSIAYLVTGNISIYESQVPTRADSPAHRGEFTVPLIQTISVGQAMRLNVVTAAPDERAADAERRMGELGLRGLPVVDDGRLVGMFTATDALHARERGNITVRDAMSTELVVAHPGDSLHAALQRMTRSGVSRLPVVEREHPDRLAGILTMRDLGAVLDLEVDALAAASRSASSQPADDILRGVLVRDAMRRKFEQVALSLPVTKVANRLSAAGAYAAVVTDDDGALAGIVTLRDVERAAELGDRPVGEIAARQVVVARPAQSVAEALAQPGAEELRQLPVVEESEGRTVVVGMLSRSNVVAAYLRARDRQAQIARRARTMARDRDGDTATYEFVVAPGDVADGRSMAELRLPADAVVTAVRRNGATITPRGPVRLQPGDRIEILAATTVGAELFAFLRGPRNDAREGGDTA
jgi:CIC family chloride channel protein